MKQSTSTNHDVRESAGPIPPTPGFDVELIRSVRFLAGIPTLSAVFGSSLRNEALKVADAEKYLGTKYHDCMATPVFLTAGWRNVPAPVFNEDLVRREIHPFVEANGRSPVEMVIREACRNVGQHAGGQLEALRYGVARFGPGGIFMKQLVCTDSNKVSHRVLLCMVADEGSGISNPSLSLVDGVGGLGGEDHRGMGIELAGSLVTLIKSNEGRWFMYDGLNHARNFKDSRLTKPQSNIPKSQWVKPLAEVELPAGEKGCQKIFLFAHPQADRQFVFQQAVSALVTSAIPSE